MMAKLMSIHRRVGRRGLFLLFLAMLDSVLGYFLLSPPAGEPPQMYPFLSSMTWAILWLVTGTVCVVGAFIRVDKVAYSAAAMIKTMWALRYAYLWYTGTPYAWVSFMIWGIFACTVLVIAGWPEEIDLKKAIRNDI